MVISRKNMIHYGLSGITITINTYQPIVLVIFRFTKTLNDIFRALCQVQYFCVANIIKNLYQMVCKLGNKNSFSNREMKYPMLLNIPFAEVIIKDVVYLLGIAEII